MQSRTSLGKLSLKATSSTSCKILSSSFLLLSPLFAAIIAATTATPSNHGETSCISPSISDSVSAELPWWFTMLVAHWWIVLSCLNNTGAFLWQVLEIMGQSVDQWIYWRKKETEKTNNSREHLPTETSGDVLRCAWHCAHDTLILNSAALTFLKTKSLSLSLHQSSPTKWQGFSHYHFIYVQKCLHLSIDLIKVTFASEIFPHTLL